LNREYQETILDSRINDQVVIPSKDPIIRKEVIEKELDFIRRKWNKMEQENLDKKIMLKKEMSDNDKKFDSFKEIEKDMILAIALGNFKLKLEKNDIRNAVKMEIRKAAMREMKSIPYCYKMHDKKLLMYHKFGSSQKKKRHNYLLQLDDLLISNLNQWETNGLKASEWKEIEGLQIAHKYQIKEIF
jgi:hypothetical protein